ncbi:hypothetical protein P153DRAFT_388741 [Dothidotthia symphoricarpi CBS 119687]|uniref:RING-type domain-containing protein n=1 Tax=Dothidotthia symphoricarpi CBS 119687 TaxID=1392245 RepID=A0A6A6A514_9PLEO|nr:uncharacterized protein P153DRAFT_388741 [Dothidotthia symphoricarpi CBS 119687]KAF2125987.1 hypothetical protein P153DRAFT_388741 [Dothidotthia symphoricarpi CBS 119687]
MPPTTSAPKDSTPDATVATANVPNVEVHQPQNTLDEVLGPMVDHAPEGPDQTLPPPPPWLAAYLATVEEFAIQQPQTSLPPPPQGFVAVLAFMGNYLAPPNQTLLPEEVAAYLANAGHHSFPPVFAHQPVANQNSTMSSPEATTAQTLSVGYSSVASPSTTQFATTSSPAAQSDPNQNLLVATNTAIQLQSDNDDNSNSEEFTAALPHEELPSPSMSELADSDIGEDMPGLEDLNIGEDMPVSDLTQYYSILNPVLTNGGPNAASNYAGPSVSFLAALSAAVEPTSPWPGWPSPMAVPPPLASLYGSSWLRNVRPPLDAVAFVNALEQVDISTIAADDMKCPHCWLPFGTTDDDDPSYTYSPDPQEDPAVSAHMLAFRDLPHCEMANNDPVKTPCGHLFGKSCLIEILERMDSICPMCRQDLRKKA